jgi:hypothetical protein
MWPLASLQARERQGSPPRRDGGADDVRHRNASVYEPHVLVQRFHRKPTCRSATASIGSRRPRRKLTCADRATDSPTVPQSFMRCRSGRVRWGTKRSAHTRYSFRLSPRATSVDRPLMLKGPMRPERTTMFRNRIPTGAPPPEMRVWIQRATRRPGGLRNANVELVTQCALQN